MSVRDADGQSESCGEEKAAICSLAALMDIADLWLGRLKLQAFRMGLAAGHTGDAFGGGFGSRL